MAFDQTTRNRLARFVSDTRSLLAEEFTRQLQNDYGLDPNSGDVTDLARLEHLDDARRETARLLRDTMDHYLASADTATPAKAKKARQDVLDRIVREQAFTILNRLCALRMAEARGLLIESIAKGYQSKGFQLYQRLAGTALGETGACYRLFIFSVFDEFAVDLPVLFDRFSPQGRLFPREAALLNVLQEINHPDIDPLWAEDETIGWIYQYFNSVEERRQMRAASQAPRNSRELAVRNQFFTPRYVVEFLTDNTLGRIWYEMTKGESSLKDSCRYLVRRPTEIFLSEGEAVPEQDDTGEELSQEELLKQPVHILHRPLKDPRDIKMLDPACGSMHFGLYAFDLFEHIYEEAWEIEAQRGADGFARTEELKPLHESYTDKDAFLRDMPRLIIERNIHGIDIDPRAVQIAGLSLWLRAQRSWQVQNVKALDRPQIQRSNIVCAEPMPGEADMLEEFTDQLQPKVLGQLVKIIFEKMKLAGEAGSLLKIEEEIKDAVSTAHEAYRKYLLEQQKDSEYLPGMAPKREVSLFDFADLPKVEDFWSRAESLVFYVLHEFAIHAQGSESVRRKLFSNDAARGFAFIDLMKKKFDSILMNPPFGDSTEKLNTYLKKTYHFGRPDLYMCFFFRCARDLLASGGRIGEISSRTFHTLDFYEPMRREFLLGSTRISLLIDLGSGVLDTATVETSAYIVEKGTCKQPLMIFDLVNEEDKESLLKNKIIDLFDINDLSQIWVRQHNWFAQLPNGALAYWLPKTLESAFSGYPQLDSECAAQPLIERSRSRSSFGRVRQGLIPGDLFRFTRMFWEVPSKDIGRGRSWIPMMKGGDFSRYYSYEPWLFNWHNEGHEPKAFAAQRYGGASRTIKNDKEFFKGGLTFPRVSSVGLNIRMMPENSIFSDTGMAIIPDNKAHAIGLLGICNSRMADAICEALHPGRKFEIAHLAAIPIKEALLSDSEFCRVVEKAYEVAQHVCDPISHARELVNAIQKNKSLEVGCKEFVERISMSWLDLSKLQIEIDNKVYESYGVEPSEREYLRAFLHDKRGSRIGSPVIESTLRPEMITEKNIDPGISLKDALLLALEKITLHAFEMVPAGICEMDSESIHVTGPSNLIAHLKRAANNLCGLEEEKFEQDIISILGVPSILETFFCRDGIFETHYKLHSFSPRYSPIIWPLSSNKGNYTVWLYYQCLTDQTLYTCVNDFVDPKLKQVSDDASSLRGKSNRSSSEEKELERLSDLELELKDFRDELLRIARFWKPNLNDGVQITAAPLWNLFQHRQWKARLKETWEKLEAGDYDWSHLALSIWPDRVVRASHKDRSYAIAHDLDDQLWHEVEVEKVGRGGRVTTTTEWQPRDLSSVDLQGIIAEVKAR